MKHLWSRWHWVLMSVLALLFAFAINQSAAIASPPKVTLVEAKYDDFNTCLAFTNPVAPRHYYNVTSLLASHSDEILRLLESAPKVKSAEEKYRQLILKLGDGRVVSVTEFGDVFGLNGFRRLTKKQFNDLKLILFLAFPKSNSLIEDLK